MTDTQIHILSNGRAFAKREYAKELARVGGDQLLLEYPCIIRFFCKKNTIYKLTNFTQKQCKIVYFKYVDGS